jgi:hypothetical protein
MSAVGHDGTFGGKHLIEKPDKGSRVDIISRAFIWAVIQLSGREWGRETARCQTWFASSSRLDHLE